jgi:hypothetical protein
MLLSCIQHFAKSGRPQHNYRFWWRSAFSGGYRTGVTNRLHVFGIVFLVVVANLLQHLVDTSFT